MKIRRIDSPPENVDQFVSEIVPAYERLYGTEPAEVYRATGAHHISTAIAHPAIEAFGGFQGKQAEALLLLKRGQDRDTVSFLHTLEGRNREDRANAILDYSLAQIATGPARAILSEYIPFMPDCLDRTYFRHDFRRVDRQLMGRHGAPPAPAQGRFNLQIGHVEDWRPLAHVLYEAYASHPERMLFDEVQSAQAAEGFLAQTAAGMYGPCPEDFVVSAWDEGRCIGVALGCEVVAGTGFVLHMAVLPSQRGGGLGTLLFDRLSANFAAYGLKRSLLAVTCTNPATRLYARAGFDAVHTFPVYYRPKR